VTVLGASRVLVGTIILLRLESFAWQNKREIRVRHFKARTFILARQNACSKGQTSGREGPFAVVWYSRCSLTKNRIAGARQRYAILNRPPFLETSEFSWTIHLRQL
jgi:hypothetical protein